jgi:hypothetical protein
VIGSTSPSLRSRHHESKRLPPVHREHTFLTLAPALACRGFFFVVLPRRQLLPFQGAIRQRRRTGAAGDQPQEAGAQESGAARDRGRHCALALEQPAFGQVSENTCTAVDAPEPGHGARSDLDLATSCCGLVPRSRRFQKRQEPSSHAKRFPSSNVSGGETCSKA